MFTCSIVEGDVHLFDCGENAQMRMLQAGLKRSKIQNIFISHFDTDHYSGLMGLLATLQLQRREIPLRIVGPVGIKEYVEWNVNFDTYRDRKSTRLNSSHVAISYAVFCLKKKKSRQSRRSCTTR